MWPYEELNGPRIKWIPEKGKTVVIQNLSWNRKKAQ